MSHLGERITEFVFEELPAGEMAEARAHVAQCAECAGAVQQFQRTRSLLRAVPDVNPPRSAVLTFEKPQAARSWAWRWLAPMAAAAVLVFGVALAAPIHVQWQNSQLTIAMGGASILNASIVEEQNAQIQQLQGQVSYLETLQKQTTTQLIATQGSLQLLSQGASPVGD